MKQVPKVKATVETIKWGYYDNTWKPLLSVESGAIIDIEALNHQSGDAPDLMFDEAIKKIYDETERNMGDHIVTGPVEIKGAKPGDVLEVKILDMKPRVQYGSNVLANWGYLAEDFNEVESIVIYEVDKQQKFASPIFHYTYPHPINAPGLVVEPGTVERIPIKEALKIPLNYHFGIAGVLPKESGRIHTLHPKPFGGNVDNKNFVMDTSMFYRVEVPGAGFYVGDSHFAQGDGELSGTAIEGSINGRVQLILHKNFEMGENPILETETNWQTHGYGDTLDDALHEAAREALTFIQMHHKVSKEIAYSLLSVKCDFQVTQIANGRKGIHCCIPKTMFTKTK